MQVQVFYQPGFQPRDPAAYQWFCGVDTNRSGTVDEHELQRALSAGGWAAFSRKTTRKLMNMFDADRSHSLGYGEFEQLVAYLRSWQAQFQAASHGTGRIGVSHMPAVLAQLGYHFPPPLATSIFQACALRRRQARAPLGRCRGWRAHPQHPSPHCSRLLRPRNTQTTTTTRARWGWTSTSACWQSCTASLPPFARTTPRGAAQRTCSTPPSCRSCTLRATEKREG